MIPPILSGILSAVSAVAGLLVFVSEVRKKRHTNTRWERVMAVVLLAVAAVIGGVAAYQTLPPEPVVHDTADSSGDTVATETAPVYTLSEAPVPQPDTGPLPPQPKRKPTPQATSIQVFDRNGEAQPDLAGAIRAALPPALRSGAKVTGQLTENCGKDETFDHLTCRVQLKVTIDRNGALDGFTLNTRGGGFHTEDASEQARGRLIDQIQEHFAKQKDTSTP